MLNTISAILQAAAASPEKRTIAVAAAHDRDVLEAVKEARRGGIAQAVLTGRGEEIRQILRSLEEDPADYAILEGEMCIRDSHFFRARLGIAALQRGGNFRRRVSQLLQGGCGPVSYTHLPRSPSPVYFTVDSFSVHRVRNRALGSGAWRKRCCLPGNTHSGARRRTPTPCF